MNKIQEICIKSTLYLFFGYVLVLNGIEQFYFLNHGLFITFLAILGLGVTYFSKLKYSLFFRLLVFPVIGSNIFQSYVEPIHQSSTLLLYLFWMLYLGLIVLITYLDKVIVLFIVSIWGFFVTFSDLPSKIKYSISYWENFYVYKRKSPVLDLVNKLRRDNQTIYLICLDGYPADLKTSVSQQLSVNLKNNGFKKGKNLSIGDTPWSIPFLLSGYIPKSIIYAQPFWAYNVQMEKLLNKVYNEQSIQVQAIFDNYWLTNYYFPLFTNPPVNPLIQLIFKRYLDNPESVLDLNYINGYHFNLINHLNATTKIQFIHFLTFHGFGYFGQKDLYKDVKYANMLLYKSLSKIQKLNPNAHVIIFSDHGERFVKGYDRTKSILFYK